MPGESWSSSIVFGDKIFITSVLPENKPVIADLIRNPPAAANANAPAATPAVTPAVTPAATAATKPVSPPSKTEDNSFKEEIYRWEVTCIDLKTGKELWKQVARKGSPKMAKHSGSTYACETPVTDGKRVYAYFGGPDHHR